MLALIQRVGQAGFNGLRRLLAYGFEQPLNPLLHLGALTIFFCWIVLVSGIWLLIFFKTSVNGAFESVEYLTHQQWYLGGVMRSLHRYASDTAIITVLLHIMKEFALDRHRGKHWFSWITGVPLIWLIILLGITGYWLVWDELAHYVALTSAELLDGLPIFTDPMARNFLSDESLSDRFFTLMAFLHLIGLPLFLVFGIWLHVFRINRPNINPPRALMVGTLLAMLVLSLVFPAVSQGKAVLSQVPESLGLDWYYLLVFPLMQSWPAGGVWALLLGISLLIFIAPWLPPARARPVAVVDLDNCNGCERCVDDCPFGAVAMAPRSDGKRFASEAVVDPNLCTSCGICVGSCPTGTPFRIRTALEPGIDLPNLPIAEIRATIHAVTTNLSGDNRLLVIGCQGSSDLTALSDEQTAVVAVTCLAQLPPSFFDYVLNRNHADGIYLAGCSGGDCDFRLGTQWTEQRISRQRDPRLRKRVDTSHIALGWQHPWAASSRLGKSVEVFRSSLAGPVQPGGPDPAAGQRRITMLPALALAYAAFIFIAGLFSIWPRYALLDEGEAIVSLTFTHAGQRISECRTLSQKELDALPPNMRLATDCPRGRLPIQVAFSIDDESRYQAVVAPSGIWKDGESTVYQRLIVPAGSRQLFIGMRDSDRQQGFDFQHQAQLDIQPGQHVLVEFDDVKQRFVFR